jgi:hypothetical protein
MNAAESSYGLCNCPIGGGVEACFLFRWYTARGIQKFQPLEPGEYDRDPFNPRTFRKDRAVHQFEKMTLPSDWAQSGWSDVWVRIE